MTKLERTWWFAALAGGIGAFSARWLMEYAGIGSPSGIAQWLVFGCCMAMIVRLLSFLGWMILLLAKPTSPLLDTASSRKPAK